MRFLSQFVDVRRDEIPVTGLLFLSFFLTIAVFQIIRPLKNGIFVETFGATNELYVKLLNIVAAAIAVFIFTYLYNRLSRRGLILTICSFFAVAFLTLVVALRDPAAVTIWGFYVIGDLITTTLVVAFWAYATDITTSDQAKRLFGLIGSGLVIGGWVGISFARTSLAAIGMEGLLIACSLMMCIIMLATLTNEYLLPRSESFKGGPGRSVQPSSSEGQKRNAALEGASLVSRSSYLTAIVGIMAFYEIASQIMDFQFKRLTESLPGVMATQAFMTDVYFFANSLSVILQLFVVSFIMRRFGLVVTLLAMPVAIMLSSGAFLAVPTLFFAGLLVVSDNGFNYSIQQTGRETLYSITTEDEKYKARAFTNMFVQRLAKGVAILGTLVLGLLAVDVRYLSLVAIAVVIAMILCSLYAGRYFNKRSRQQEDDSKSA